jgi:hypothetical protein
MKLLKYETKISTTIAVHTVILRDMIPCSLVGIYRRFGGIYCHCLLT